MALKTCATCGEIKDETEFVWRNKLLSRRWGTCRTCQSKQRKDWYEKNKEAHISNVKNNKQRAIAEAQQFIWNYLSAHPCIDCGESNPTVLEFDHVRGIKRRAVGEMGAQGYAIGVIMAEIEKCVVRCGNCHRRKTAEERGWFRLEG
jgi:hypothetical protein